MMRFKLTLVALLTILVGVSNAISDAHAQGAITTQVPTQIPAQTSQAFPGSFAPLAERLLPTVVNISSTGRLSFGEDVFQNPIAPLAPQQPQSPFDDFFEQYQEQQFGGPAVESASLGSGFIIDGQQGIIVTNYHVIAEASDIRVTLYDDSSYRAEVIGSDEKTDIALLKIDTKGRILTQVSFGNSDALRVGDWILAIGNPFGLGGTVTAGIVSARSRDINAGPYDDFIQTDASINRGNSGGPMFNIKGELIGINTAIFSPSGGSIGIGFAIPINMSKSVISQLIETGEVRRGWLGVKIQTVTPEIAEAIGLTNGAQGALVAEVIADSPAEAAQIKAYDVIIAFNGQNIASMRDLPIVVAEAPVDKPLPVSIMRNGEKIELDITLDSVSSSEETQAVQPEEFNNETQDQNQLDEIYIDRLSMSLAPINPLSSAQYGLIDGMSGLVITHIDDFSDPATKGLQPGDVIIEVDRNRLSNVDQITSAIDVAASQDRHVLLLLVDRAGDEQFVAIKIEAAE